MKNTAGSYSICRSFFCEGDNNYVPALV